MSDCGCDFEAENAVERKTLQWVLAINAIMFVLEMAFGLLAQSTGLIADSLDMFADATVYAISLYAVGKSGKAKLVSAKLSGVLQILLALAVVGDVIRRWVGESEPVSGLMMLFAVLALAANIACLRLLQRHRGGAVHMRASIIFSTSDVIANVGVFVSGFLVWLLESRYPDLIVGLAISIVVLRGGVQILTVTLKQGDG